MTSFLVVCLIVEGAARWFLPQWAPRTAVLSRLWQQDSTLGWSHIPGSTDTFAAFGFDTAVTINRKGFRDLEREYAKDPSIYRIVVLGDSMVWGYGVEDDQTFTRVTESRLQNVELINLGVSGYGTDQELLLLREQGLRYQGDLYVLVVVDNDFISNTASRMFTIYEKPYFSLAHDGTLELHNTPVPDAPFLLRQAVMLTRASFVLNRAAQALNEARATREMWPPNAQDAVWDEPFPRVEREHLTVALIEQIQREVESAGAEFLLMIINNIGQTGVDLGEYFAPRARVLNLEVAFGGLPVDTLHVDGSHWNAAGHALVSEQLIAYLVREQLLPTGSGGSAR